MNENTANLSGSLVARGILALLFGVAAVFWPHETVLTLVYLFSAFVLVNGVIDLLYGVVRLFNGAISGLTRVLLPLLGIFQIGVGVYLLRHPKVTFATFILLIGFTLIIRGVIEIVEGLFENEGSAAYRTVLVIAGLLAAVVGVIVLFQPVASGIAFVWLLGLYALVTGPLMIALALDVKHSVPAKNR